MFSNWDVKKVVETLATFDQSTVNHVYFAESFGVILDIDVYQVF